MVLKRNVYFTPGGSERRLHIYLPTNYETCQERYPVLYMFDGHNLFYDSDATYGTCMGMKDFLDGWHKKLIVVGIECSGDDYTRVHEYCPFDIQSRIYGQIHGRGDTTMDWLIHELKPLIDRDYRTMPFRETTAIAGYSMAGQIVLYAVLHYNRWFSKAAAISPSILPAMEPLELEIQNHSFSPDTKIFFSWGTDEDDPDTNWYTAQNILKLEGMVQQKRVQTYRYCQRDGQHNEASWKHQVPIWMNFLWC